MIASANGDVLGYGFWSVANFAGFTSAAAPNARYLMVDGIDPLIHSGNHTGIIPVAGSSDLANVTLAQYEQRPANLNLNYPIWSLIRFVTVDSAATTAATGLAADTQTFVSRQRHISS